MSWIGTAVSVGTSLYAGSQQKKAASRASDEAGRAADLAYERSLPWDVKGMFGGAEYDEDGRQLNMSLSDPWQSEYDLAMSGAGKQRGYIAGMEADPMAAGQKFYEMQKALYAPEQEQDRLAQENRLLAQGMIDTYRGRAATDLGMAETIGQLPQKYAETGRGIGTGMSSISEAAGKMQSSAAQARAASTSNIYGGLAKQFGGLAMNDYSGNSGGGYQGSYEPWGNQGGFEFDQGGPEWWTK